jgi:predicted RNase H-like nuclease (RuvC/YqgF family)
MTPQETIQELTDENYCLKTDIKHLESEIESLKEQLNEAERESPWVPTQE